MCSSADGQIVMLYPHVAFSSTPQPFSHNSLSSANLLRKLQQPQNPRECCSIWDYLFLFVSGKWLQKALAIMRLTLFPLLSKISILYYQLSSVSYSLSSFILIFSGKEKKKDKQEKKTNSRKNTVSVLLSIDIMQALCWRLQIDESK